MLPTPRKPVRPVLWIIAGPNGSGKSTFYNRSDIEGWGGSVWIINPDLLTLSIVEREGIALEAANLMAVQRIEAWLDASIEVYQTIGVETVLSSPKYRRLVEKAQRQGFEVRMIYIVLESAQLQIERVRIRVSEGGHDVPTQSIVDRRTRSFDQFAWFLRKVDCAYIFDNSTGEPRLLGQKESGDGVEWFDSIPADLEAVLSSSKG